MPYPVPFITYLPWSPVKQPSQEASSLSLFREKRSIPRASFTHLSKSLVVDTLPSSPVGPLWKEMPFSRVFSTYSLGSPAREPSLQVPFKELPLKCPTSRAPFGHLSKSQVDEPTPGCPTEHHEERCPSPTPSFHNPGYPVKEPSLVALHSEPLQREHAIPRAPFNPSI